jgi:protein-S-isoprenylcysteine O-methyltransferase Ste14
MLMLIFAGVALQRWNTSQDFFFLMLFLKDFGAGIFFLSRRPSETRHNTWQASAAYISAAIPLFYLSGGSVPIGLAITSKLMLICGFLISTLAIIELGNQIGISPAKRGKRCRTGVYRIVNHPMYLGYVIAELATVLANPLNGALFTVSLLLYLQRCRWENAILVKKLLKLS